MRIVRDDDVDHPDELRIDLDPQPGTGHGWNVIAHLGCPADDGHLPGRDLIRVATRRELDSRGLDVVRGSAWDALLEAGVAAALLAGRDHDARVHPFGHRSSVVGRRASARMMPSPTAR